ncbi:MAG: acyloxyacyl hydrolase [Marinilabiliaceae bacterium]
MKRAFFLTAVLLLSSLMSSGLKASADDEGPLLYLGGHIYGGGIEIHSSKIEHFRGVRPVGAGIDLSWKFVSENAYALCQCYPSLGVSINYWDFGHASLGHALSSLFLVEPVLFTPLDSEISLKSGLGVSYLSNPYDEDTNPQNVTYSTRFSFPLMIGLSYTQSLDEKWSLQLSGMFQHISNGGVKQPNLGINYLTAGIGVRRKLDNRSLPPPPNAEPFDPSEGLRRVKISLISGLKEPEGAKNKSLVASLSGEYARQFGRINAWSAGGMFEHDKSRGGTGISDLSRMSLMAGHTFLLGRFSFAQKGGVYLWSGHATKAPWFQYYTLDFSATENLGIGVGLKAHGKVAEFLSVRFLVFWD